MNTTTPKKTDPLIDQIISDLRAKTVKCGTGAEILKVRKRP